MENTMPKSKQIMPTEEQIEIILAEITIGSAYWAESFEMKNGVKYSDYYNPQWELEVTFDDDGKLSHETLTIDKLKANWATFVMYSNSRHFADLVQDKFDWTTTDCAFQIALFDEVYFEGHDIEYDQCVQWV